MSLTYITGNSGSGKSSVLGELRRRGFEAYGTDEDNIAFWYHKITGKRADRPLKTDGRTNDWYNMHAWKISREEVEALAVRAENKAIFLCGAVSNIDEMTDLFRKIIYLKIDKDTLRVRLKNRSGNDFGKAPNELKNILGWHELFEDSYKRQSAVMIDAAKPLGSVVDAIVSNLS